MGNSIIILTLIGYSLICMMKVGSALYYNREANKTNKLAKRISSGWSEKSRHYVQPSGFHFTMRETTLNIVFARDTIHKVRPRI